MVRTYRAIIIAAMATMLSGCSLLGSIPLLPTPEKPDTLYSWSEAETREPVFQELNDGFVYRGEKTVRRVDIDFKKAKPRKTYFQRIMDAMGGIVFWTVIAVFVGLVFFPTVTIPRLVGQGRRYKRALGQITDAMEEINGDAWKEVGAKLSTKMDPDTKMLIAEIKHKNK